MQKVIKCKNPEFQYKVIAVVTDEPLYRLCWLLNNNFGWSLSELEPFKVKDNDNEYSFPVFSWIDEITRCRFCVIQNKSEQGLVFEKFVKHADFWILIESNAEDIDITEQVADFDIAELVQTVKSIGGIRIAQEIEIGKLKKKNNFFKFLFSQMSRININLSNYNTIIFDFGGVILNIDPDLSRTAFAALLGVEKATEIEKMQLTQQLERGDIDWNEFVGTIEQVSGLKDIETEISQAWLAMLLNYVPERIEWIKKLGQTHKLIMLSNTNCVHFNYFHDKLKKEFGVSFYDLFSKVYLSNEMHLLKPDKAIFERVIAEENLSVATTLFIEDTEENAIVASQLGIATLVITRNDNFFDYFQ